MHSEERQREFLIGEYLSFWEELGVDDLRPRAGALRARLDRAVAPSEAPPPLSLDTIRRELGDGCGTRLCGAKERLVFGAGDPRARLMFVGEAPGAEDDRRGLPFQGPDGALLTKIIEAMGYHRETVYLTHVVKCRTPQDRAPTPEEARLCATALRQQIELVRPVVIVALGAGASAALLGTPAPLAATRGRLHPLAWDGSVQVMPTHAPAQLLRQPELKKTVWEDMKKVKAHLEGAA